jgi:uncharacterized Zn-finger protein
MSDVKLFACKLCLNLFSQSNGLRQHYCVYVGEKSFSCGVCQKSFAEASKLSNHKRVHTGEKPYIFHMYLQSCTYHRYAVIGASVYTRMNAYIQLKRYINDVCLKSCTQLGTLGSHKRVYTGDKPYTCNVCLKSFVQRLHLRRHGRRVHTGTVDSLSCGNGSMYAHHHQHHHRFNVRFLLT